MNNFHCTKVRLLAGLVSIGLLAAGPVALATIIVGPGFAEAGYTPVYELAIPNSANHNAFAIPYALNNSGLVVAGSFSRIGYYLELGTVSGSVDQWISISFDAAGFTSYASKIGVPNTGSGEFYQQSVANMNVFSNVGG